MSSAQIDTIIAAGVPLMVALTAYLIYLTHQVRETTTTLEINVNHRMDELLAATKDAAHAIGLAEGQSGKNPSE